jgi:phage tail-like protein
VAEFSVNPYRRDPYSGSSFRVRWDGENIAGVFRISGLERVTDVVTERNGADPTLEHRIPGRTRYEPITLERGRTHDTAFEDWANLISSPAGPMSLAHFRKDVLIELINEQGAVAMAFHVHRAWPSHYTALGPLDADSDSLALESLVLEHEGFERDTGVSEPLQT